MAIKDMYTALAEKLDKDYAKLGEESSEVYKRNYIPLPGDFNIIEKEALEDYEKEAGSLAEELASRGLRFDAIITRTKSISLSKSITIKEPEKLSEEELMLLFGNSRSDKYLMYVLTHLDKVVVVDAENADFSASMLAIAPGILNIAVITSAKGGHKAEVLELLMSVGKKAQLGLLNVGSVAKGSSATVTAIHNESENCTVLSFASNVSAGSSSFVLNSAYLGGSIVHARNMISANGFGDYAGLNDMGLCTVRQQMDILNYITNGAEGTKTEVHSKAVTQGDSKCIMKGFAKIEKGAKNSTSYIYQRGISIDRSSYIEALPDMSIDESMVKATHSSAVAPIDENSLFYIMSRGLDYDASARLMLFSFLGDIVSRLESDYARIIAVSLIEKKLAGAAQHHIPEINAGMTPVFSKAEGIEEHYKYNR
ncbi:MAG: SufD family Fe-S cluster assembly protein [Candidatus Marsarchaeota archaeon]|jgi:hypothetical protein|nr:SufD family Fe-S cluster assembly protein [Candidatus Marsarchaeota archaeon]MCL5418616.1 SufD family Fe-S cluster assembly protein [Candidatus Marsarchaeota archaeon]